jgi:MraZ protein
VDGKGRMSIPADFRRVLEAGDPEWAPGLPIRCQIVYGDHLFERLQVYSVVEFEKIMTRIETTPDSNKDKANITHLMITQSEPLTVDKDGRTVLPIRHREKLGMTEGDLSFRGCLSYFELWPAESYKEKVSAPSKEFLADKGENFNPMSLIGP